MSPQLNAAFPWLPELFGGRQSARTLHFIAAMSLFAFFIVHIVMVVLSGFWNNIRSMITGRYKIEV
jgi:thiosulfate reductase cytochrome b subunit